MTIHDPEALGQRPLRVIVVAYHAVDALRACLAPLAGRLDVVVVDNSSDPDVRSAAELFGARYIDPGSNRGFGAGVNVALREVLAGPPVDLLLLNPDAVTTAADVGRMATALARSPADIAALSPALRTSNGAAQRVMWPFPSPARAWLEALGGGSLLRRQDFAVGTALLLRWEAVREVGLFDERFFLYAEETDWQRRAALLGWRSTMIPEIVADHIGGGTSSDPKRREALCHAGTETYVRKWFGARGWASYRVAVIFGAVLRQALLRRQRRDRASLRRQIYVRGPRRFAGLDDT